jgi:hypothetical protein
MTNLKRYWFTFEPSSAPNSLNLGCGVTAYDQRDAEAMLQDVVFRNAQVPTIREVVEDVDVSTLDPKHVLPNMDSCNRRGVWFPKGYPAPSAVKGF